MGSIVRSAALAAAVLLFTACPANEGEMGPAGPPGPTGPSGPPGASGADGDDARLGLSFRGPWDPEAQYLAGDQVVWQGQVYIALRDNLGYGPGDSLDEEGHVQNPWLLLSGGTQGPPGPQGPQGEMGPAGPSGPPGEIGAMGPPGPMGPQGIQGPPGPGVGLRQTDFMSPPPFPPMTLTQIVPVDFVAPKDGTAVVLFTGTCCVDTNPALPDEDPSTWLWLGIYDDRLVPWDKTTIELPNLPGASLHYCLPTTASHPFAVPAGANHLSVKAKTNGKKGSCAGYATVLFTEKQLDVPSSEE